MLGSFRANTSDRVSDGVLSFQNVEIIFWDKQVHEDSHEGFGLHSSATSNPDKNKELREQEFWRGEYEPTPAYQLLTWAKLQYCSVPFIFT